MDVVRRRARNWRHPPFSGARADGYVWGRGTMDDKASVMAILDAVEHLLDDGFSPIGPSIWPSVTTKKSAAITAPAKIAELLIARVKTRICPRRGIEHPRRNHSRYCGARGADRHRRKGLSESPPRRKKLRVDIAQFRRRTRPSASSAERCTDSKRRRFRRASGRDPPDVRIPRPRNALDKSVGARQSLAFRSSRAETIDPFAAHQCRHSNHRGADDFHAGGAENVLPASATAVVNLRLLPGDTIAGAIEHVRSVIHEPSVKITPSPVQAEPSPISDIKARASIRSSERSVKLRPRP